MTVSIWCCTTVHRLCWWEDFGVVDCVASQEVFCSGGGALQTATTCRGIPGGSVVLCSSDPRRIGVVRRIQGGSVLCVGSREDLVLCVAGVVRRIQGGSGVVRRIQGGSVVCVGSREDLWCASDPVEGSVDSDII